MLSAITSSPVLSTWQAMQHKKWGKSSCDTEWLRGLSFIVADCLKKGREKMWSGGDGCQHVGPEPESIIHSNIHRVCGCLRMIVLCVVCEHEATSQPGHLCVLPHFLSARREDEFFKGVSACWAPAAVSRVNTAVLSCFSGFRTRWHVKSRWSTFSSLESREHSHLALNQYTSKERWLDHDSPRQPPGNTRQPLCQAQCSTAC